MKREATDNKGKERLLKYCKKYKLSTKMCLFIGSSSSVLEKFCKDNIIQKNMILNNNMHYNVLYYDIT